MSEQKNKIWQKEIETSLVKTWVFMNIINPIILTSPLTVPKMAARGEMYPRVSIRCEAM